MSTKVGLVSWKNKKEKKKKEERALGKAKITVVQPRILIRPYFTISLPTGSDLIW